MKDTVELADGRPANWSWFGHAEYDRCMQVAGAPAWAVYCALLRATAGHGGVRAIVPLARLCEAVNRTRNAVRGALEKLEMAGLVRRVPGSGGAHSSAAEYEFLVLQPESDGVSFLTGSENSPGDKTDLVGKLTPSINHGQPESDGVSFLTGSENCPPRGEKTAPLGVRKLTGSENCPRPRAEAGTSTLDSLDSGGEEKREKETPPTPLAAAPELPGMDAPAGPSDADAPGDERAWPNGPLGDLFGAWNEICAPAGLPKITKTTDSRRVRGRRLLRQYSLAEIRQMMERVARSRWCHGYERDARGQWRRWSGNWVASFDWFLQPDVPVKILEGRCDDVVDTDNNPRNLEGLTYPEVADGF